MSEWGLAQGRPCPLDRKEAEHRLAAEAPCGASKWGTSLPGAMTFNLVTKDYCSPGDKKAELSYN